MESPKDLTFAVVDGMAFAASSIGQDADTTAYAPRQLGPLLELAMLRNQGRVCASRCGVLQHCGRLNAVLSPGARNAVVELGQSTGFMHLGSEVVPATELTKLSIVAKRSALAAGFGDRPAGQLSAALGELLSNVVEHSQAVGTGIVAYQAHDNCFEFVVADQGVGALQSLRTNEKFTHLESDREALPLVLEDGCSRLSDPLRGRGFNDIFRGLANHSGTLRFRSGDAAVVIDGQSPRVIRPKVKKKPYLQGFLASISCRP